ncbi:hypothetical protein F5B18DRAFT_632436 [Nemania serpens]|nr:hypothetical protein F5B18DRAFT_632436 [Nemania serpens]
MLKTQKVKKNNNIPARQRLRDPRQETMTPVTEVVLVTLKRNADMGITAQAVASLGAQPGCLGVRTWREHRDPEKVHFVISWDDIQSHRAFERKTEVHRAVLGLLGEFMESFETPYHVALKPTSPAAVLGGDGSGVALLARAYFPGGEAFADQERERVEAAFDEFVDGFGGAGFTGEVAGGWSYENDIEHRGEGSRMFFFAVGWQSTEAALRFKDAGGFGEVVSWIEGWEGLRDVQVALINRFDAA